jgi:hypothetical protein
MSKALFKNKSIIFSHDLCQIRRPVLKLNSPQRRRGSRDLAERREERREKKTLFFLFSLCETSASSAPLR